MIKHVVKTKKYFSEDTLAILLAYFKPDTPFMAKLVGGLTLLYIFLPVDIIPDVIPFAGWLDDIFIGYQLTNWAKSFIPEKIMIESRAEAKVKGRVIKRWLILLLIVFILFSIAMIFVLWRLVEWLFGTF